MGAAQGEPVLVVESRPETRQERAALQVGLLGLGPGVCLVAAVAVFLKRCPNDPNLTNAITGALTCVISAGLLPVIYVFTRRHTPRGRWRFDADGAVFRGTRGEAVAVRWKEIEWVAWGRRVVALRKGQTTLKIPLELIDEPARSETLARLEAILGTDFDLTIRPMTDRLNGIEPVWWNLTLRTLRVAVVSLGVGGAVMGSFFWVMVRYSEQGAWQGGAVFLGWNVLLMGWLLRGICADLRINPVWRRRIGKTPTDDLGEPL